VPSRVLGGAATMCRAKDAGGCPCAPDCGATTSPAPSAVRNAMRESVTLSLRPEGRDRLTELLLDVGAQLGVDDARQDRT
jgi:hypothetical protein